MRLAGPITSVALVAICAASSPSTVPAEPAARVGVSHVNIAVADLDQASADYARLGFALKEGRPHPDGIRNRHVKFRDGTDRPEHFAHANGATSLVGVTLAGENLDPEQALFRAFGRHGSSCPVADSASERPAMGSGRTEGCVVLHDRSVVRLRHGAAPGGRRIAALEVRVAETATVMRVLASAHVPFRTDASRARLTVEGEITHGVGLTFATGAAHDAR